MDPLRFEKVTGGIYHLLFHVDGFFYPVEEAHVQELKAHLQSPPEAFFNALTAKLGYSKYLKGAIENAVAACDDAGALAKSLKEQLQSL